ncbi:MAG: response regulator [Gammaproteobacteria bacterium]
MTYKVLVVDDSKLARMAVVKALKSCYPDGAIVEAGSADAALSAMQNETPDIALVDFNMPARDGLLVAADLRQLSPQMPIAIVSANHQQEIVNRAAALGATFLSKPVIEKDLSAFLKAATRELQDAVS